jgi:GT2 family glycosyltransferase
LSCRLFPTLGDKLARRLPFGFIRDMRREAEMVDWDHGTARGVDYVIGACQAVRKTALAEVGLLDERIFYGPEDIDFCLRLRQAGWQVVYHPQSVVVHTERRITRSFRSMLLWKHGLGLARYFWKHGYLFSRRRLYARIHNRQSGALRIFPSEAPRPRATMEPTVDRCGERWKDGR